MCQTFMLAAHVVLLCTAADRSAAVPNPFKKKGERRESSEERRRRILMENIDAYTGTSLGQREVE